MTLALLALAAMAGSQVIMLAGVLVVERRRQTSAK